VDHVVMVILAYVNAIDIKAWPISVRSPTEGGGKVDVSTCDFLYVV
jgi:hypothetical protein